MAKQRSSHSPAQGRSRVQSHGTVAAPTTSEEDASIPKRSAPFMQRGVSQLLFNYLPKRTVDWEDGLAIVMLGGVQLSSIWEDDRAIALLNEIGELLDRWRAAGGNVDPQFPDPRTEQGRFAIGLPEGIEATVLETALVCQQCSRLYFPDRREVARSESGTLSLVCHACGKRTLRQLGQVFVHGCGELVPITRWIPATRRAADGTIEPTRHPIQCPRCGADGQLAMPGRSERIKDMKIVCQRCDTVVIDRLIARCERCLQQIIRERRTGAGGQEHVGENDSDDRSPEDTIVTRVAMRISRYSASDTYYPQTLSMLRLDRPAIATSPDPEQTLLNSMLSSEQRPETNRSQGDAIAAFARRLQMAEATGDRDEAARIRDLIVTTATAPRVSVAPPPDENFVPAAPDLSRAISESLAFRSTVNYRHAAQVIRIGGAATELLLDRVEDARIQLGLKEILLVDDLPVITATFGYTRRSFDPTYEELSSQSLPTQIRVFPSLDHRAAQRLSRADLVGTVPILAREGEHEGIFLSLDPGRVIHWLEANKITLPMEDAPPMARILMALEEIDRYYDKIWDRPIRRLVFGLVHSLSHAAMRAASRYAGIERTSISEYIFLPLLGTVIFDNSSPFRLGGVETLVRDQLSAFLDALAEEATSCIYDTECIDHSGACHGCIHSPEIACRVFNHGLSRAFLIGGHAPWADIATNDRIVGYWTFDGIAT